MAADDRYADRDIEGDWYGVMVHSPSRGVMHVSFVAENGHFRGEWDFPSITHGTARRGTFRATRFVNWLFVRITSKPLANVQFQLTLLKHKKKSMLFGVIPLEPEGVPFASVTLFRERPGAVEMQGVCPLLELGRKAAIG